MRSLPRLVAAAVLAALALGTVPGPAAAHERKFEWVYSASVSDAEIKAQAALSPGNHAGTMKMTLKRKVDGEWRFVSSKVAGYGDDGYFTAIFSMLGDEKCKVFARHTAPNHPTIKKAGNSFDC
jgi:hypothetical protein